MAVTAPFDAEETSLQQQLAMANALRTQGMSQDIGQGYQGGKVYIVGNPLNNVVSALGGAFLGNKANKGLGDIETRRQGEFDTFMQNRPSIYEDKVTPTEQYGPVQEGEQPLPMVPVKSKALKSASQILEDQQNWIANANSTGNPLIQSIRQQALTKGLDWPEKMMTVEAAQQTAREKNAEAALARQQQFDATQAYRDATLGIQREGVDLRKQIASQPTAAELKRKDAQDAANTAGKTMLGNLDEMQEKINALDKTEGIPNSSRSGLSNSISSLRNSSLGQTVGGILGTKEQSFRNDLNNLGKNMLLQMKNLHQMGASQMNSNMELQTYLELVQGGKTYDKVALDNLITRARREIQDRIKEVGMAPSGSSGGGTGIIEGGVPPGVTPVRTGRQGDRAVIMGSDGKTYYAQ